MCTLGTFALTSATRSEINVVEGATDFILYVEKYLVHQSRAFLAVDESKI